ncbi:hypothetical protein [Saccharopolyspora elongata]|uniref:Uncharacterized protein n=1 Tax=Saccharopolyspora elongata TaxID=2530387 RepID=A0A4R4YVN4_9PSEU|nr:hypothetical protein [Saccharopolyspora elongata]TDD47722.1 hypothetical protein E1288_23955 [Saccharopolyspora elongata]
MNSGNYRDETTGNTPLEGQQLEAGTKGDGDRFRNSWWPLKRNQSFRDAPEHSDQQPVPQRSEIGASGLEGSYPRGDFPATPNEHPQALTSASHNTIGEDDDLTAFGVHAAQPAQSQEEAASDPGNERPTHGPHWAPNRAFSAERADWSDSRHFSPLEPAEDGEKRNPSQPSVAMENGLASVGPEISLGNSGQGESCSADQASGQVNAQQDVEGRPSKVPTHVSFFSQGNGSGPTHQAFNQNVNNYWKADFVRKIPVPAAGLEACSDRRFVEPRQAGQLADAARALELHGVVVLKAPPGNGRRTAALRLLATLRSVREPLALFDLEPEWSKPSVELLPKTVGEGYVLDLSEFPEGEPDDRFGRDLANYGADDNQKGWFLVVLASPQHWKGSWFEPTSNLTVSLSSPDAKPLVERELSARSCFDRVEWLAQPAFEEIWRSNPSAQEARRLGRIIANADHQNLQKIVDEFKGWHDHIEMLLNKEPKGQGHPSLLSTRATVWAGALLHGGQSRSVLKAADALLETLEISRTPAEVLADATSSRRLQAASLSLRGDQAFHQEDKHDLAHAILQNLWEEFPTQRELLRSWAVSVAADPSIPDEDAELITKMLLRLSTARRDGDILDSIGSGIVGRRRPLAVEALTDAALDPQIGAYVRNRLYLWAKQGKEESETLKLVAEVCGGRLGEELPEIALTRLRWVAGRAPLGSRTVADAFSCLVTTRPDEVRKAMDTWFDNDKLKWQAFVVFLALASSDPGIEFLLQGVEDANGRRRFVAGWQWLLAQEADREVVNRQLDKWEKRAEQGSLSRELLIDLFADVYEPEIYRGGLNRFFSDTRDFFRSFWGQVLDEAIYRNRRRREG